MSAEEMDKTPEPVEARYAGYIGPGMLSDGDNWILKKMLQMRGLPPDEYGQKDEARRIADKIIDLAARVKDDFSPLPSFDLERRDIREAVTAQGGPFDERYGVYLTEFIATHAGGDIAAAVFCEPKEHSGIYIHWMATAPEHRGKGLQAKLLASVTGMRDYTLTWPWRADIVRRNGIPFEHAYAPHLQGHFRALSERIAQAIDHPFSPLAFTPDELVEVLSIIHLDQTHRHLGFIPVVVPEGENAHFMQFDPITYIHINAEQCHRHAVWEAAEEYKLSLQDIAMWREAGTLDTELAARGITITVPTVADFGFVEDTTGTYRMEVLIRHLEHNGIKTQAKFEHLDELLAFDMDPEVPPGIVQAAPKVFRLERPAGIPPVPAPPAQPTPAEVEKQVRHIKDRRSRGETTDDHAKDELRKLMLLDSSGQWWMIGLETSIWYTYDAHEGTWTPADISRYQP
jgi:GNAT superfamily N-acetyltransferase